jgi:hypothetical protein
MAGNPEHNNSQNNLDAAIEAWELQQDAFLKSVYEITLVPMRAKEFELRRNLYSCIRTFREVMRQIEALSDLTLLAKQHRIIDLMKDDEHKRVENINIILEQEVCKAADISHESRDMSDEEFTRWVKDICKLQVQNLDTSMGTILSNLSVRVMEISQWN